MPMIAFLGRSLLASSNSGARVVKTPENWIVGLEGGLTHIILTQVYALASNGDGDIHSVINQQGHPIGLGETVQLFRRVH